MQKNACKKEVKKYKKFKTDTKKSCNNSSEYVFL